MEVFYYFIPKLSPGNYTVAISSAQSLRRNPFKAPRANVCIKNIYSKFRLSFQKVDVGGGFSPGGWPVEKGVPPTKLDVQQTMEITVVVKDVLNVSYVFVPEESTHFARTHQRRPLWCLLFRLNRMNSCQAAREELYMNKMYYNILEDRQFLAIDCYMHGAIGV